MTLFCNRINDKIIISRAYQSQQNIFINLINLTTTYKKALAMTRAVFVDIEINPLLIQNLNHSEQNLIHHTNTFLNSALQTLAIRTYTPSHFAVGV